MTNKIKTNLFLSIVIITLTGGLLLLAGCNSEPEGITVTAVGLDQESASLTEGDTVTLSAVVTPEDAADIRVSWTSSDESVVTVTPDTENGLMIQPLR